MVKIEFSIFILFLLFKYLIKLLLFNFFYLQQEKKLKKINI